MSLSERLAAAAEARAQAEQAGTTVEVLQALTPAGSGALGLGLADPPPPPERTILITGFDTAGPVTPDPTADPAAICPTCSRTGDLGVVDLPGRTSDYSCASCGTMWRITLERSAPTR